MGLSVEMGVLMADLTVQLNGGFVPALKAINA